jgi:hypothetical protein
MSKRKIIRVRNDARRRRRYLNGNPLWPLEELYDLRNPPFVADPEFTPFDVHALGCDPKNALASPKRPWASSSVRTRVLAHRSKEISNSAVSRGTTLAIR